MENKENAKRALDAIIKKSRVHMYKPIQIAEILYRHRTYKNIDLLNLDDYRTQSKEWRNNITIKLLGSISTSSSKFQDDLFNITAMPPSLLKILGDENIKHNGAVEAYIYKKFNEKYIQLYNALNYCTESNKNTFDVKILIESFWNQPGLRRSIDKIYEIIVYSLFKALIEFLEVKVEVYIDQENINIISEFDDFAKKVMSLDINTLSFEQHANIYRVGVTNAADRGLDMYSNWGPAIQVKHLSLSTELAENIVSTISSDKIIIVCKNAEKDIITSVLNQVGLGNRIQSILTEDDLIKWYDKALRGTHSNIIGNNLLTTLRNEIMEEFPATTRLPEELINRKYDRISNSFWS